MLYRFKGGTDGEYPSGGLVAFHGALYGTTEGGANVNGTIFEVNAVGRERVVYRFKGGTDGQSPNGELVAFHGALYGTTPADQAGNATICEVSTSGKERVLYRFQKTRTDSPNGGLVAFGGVLYGTTQAVVKPDDGSVFEVTTSGLFRVLYRFKGGTDGAQPFAGLVAFGGALYGTTQMGGRPEPSRRVGSVFELTAFGRDPREIASDRAQYAATWGGPRCESTVGLGCGTVFQSRRRAKSG